MKMFLNQSLEDIPQLFSKWKEVQASLQNFYARRDRASAKPIMVEMTSVFIETIFSINEQPSPSLNNIKEAVSALKYQPVNLYERLVFILNEPDHFHAYNQLKALFDEAEKLHYKAIAIQKSASKD